MFSPLFIHIKLGEKTYKTLVLCLFKPLYVRPNNHIYCKSEDLLSSYSYQILDFVMTFEHLKNSKSYIYFSPLFIWNKTSKDYRHFLFLLLYLQPFIMTKIVSWWSFFNWWMEKCLWRKNWRTLKCLWRKFFSLSPLLQ